MGKPPRHAPVLCKGTSMPFEMSTLIVNDDQRRAYAETFEEDYADIVTGLLPGENPVVFGIENANPGFTRGELEGDYGDRRAARSLFMGRRDWQLKLIEKTDNTL